jgi:ABC-type transport system involved in cytochrome c biogenesis permease subunit
MTTLISSLLVGTLGVLLTTAVAGLAMALVGRRTTPSLVAWGPRVALILLSGALILRAVAVGHAPWSNLHEFSIAFAAALLLTYVMLARSFPIDGLGPMAAFLAAGLVGFGLGRDDAIEPLVPALQQPVLLTVHVGSAVAAYAVAAVAFLAARGPRGAADRIGMLPSAEVARAVGHRAVLVGFPILTIAIVLGSVWANLAWRSYWSNDPKELAAAATWLVFGAYLHVAGRSDRLARLAPWLVIVGFAGVLFTYVGAGLFIVGEHSYGGS